MEWSEYKLLCDQPSVMARHLIETTAHLADEAGEPALCSILLTHIRAATPLERPVDHRGDERSHMFRASFSEDEVSQVLHLLDSAQSRGGPSIAGSIKGLRAAWLEYERWLLTH